MTIRWRTESPIRQEVAAAFAAVGLAAAAALHAVWASGSPWPAASFDELADTVVGQRPFPSRRAAWTVAVLLATGAVTTCARAGLVPIPGGRNTRIVRFGAKTVAGTLLARGGIGIAVSALGVGGSTPAFRRWNLALYSPLCLALGAAAAIASRSRAST